MTAPTSAPLRLTGTQARERQRRVARRRVEGASWEAICAEFDVRTERAARDMVAAAVRHGLIREEDLPHPIGSKGNRSCHGSRRGPAREYTAPDAPPGWRRQALCRAPWIDPEEFFPIGDDWTQGENQARAEDAKAVCRRCPIQAACLADALAARDDWAIRGATTPDERRQLNDRSAS